MNQMLMIFNSEGRKFSTLKAFTPKMATAMKAIAEGYNTTFAPMTFKVHRMIQTPKGWKRV
jgi:hypothetical protein